MCDMIETALERKRRIGPAELMAELSHENLGCPRGIPALTVPGAWAVRFG